MTSVVEHTRCPSCEARGQDRSGDNLAVYSDGHTFCYACGYRTIPGLSVGYMKSRIKNQQKDGSGRTIDLPSDFDNCIADKGLTWLRKYEITDEEIETHGMGWSASNDSLVFPIFDFYRNLLMVQERKFSDPKRKYYTSGKPEKVFHILDGPIKKPIVLTEDLISAIKVSRVISAMPLWGAQISKDRLTTLARETTQLFIWLDRDKADYAVKAKVRASGLFNSVTVIITPKDPKEYSTEEISDIINALTTEETEL